MLMNIPIANDWKSALSDEFRQPYFTALIQFLKTETTAGKIIYPEVFNIFRAFALTPLRSVRVVIIGQDPYHNPHQAHGLCFSVPEGIKIPPTLRNIFKELQTDLGLAIPQQGCLDAWARQGVLLLNSALTVEENKPMSHSKIGWEQFTDAVIRKVSDECTGVIFLLWGRFAGSKSVLINAEKHSILTAAHPSPLSAHQGFFGCKHFSKTNNLLCQQGYSAINWQV